MTTDAPTLLELADSYERHGIRIARLADGRSYVERTNAMTAAACFTIADALRVRANTTGERNGG
jgi:hypothetical protein